MNKIKVISVKKYKSENGKLFDTALEAKEENVKSYFKLIINRNTVFNETDQDEFIADLILEKDIVISMLKSIKTVKKGEKNESEKEPRQKSNFE